MRIVFDIDGVIADFSETFLEYYNFRNEHQENQELLTRWAYFDCPNFKMTKDSFKTTFDEFNKFKMWEKVPMIKHADNVICSLYADGHEIIYLTSRPKNSERSTLKFLLKHGFPINNIIFCESEDKPDFAEIFKADVAIDDKPDTIDNYIKSGITAIGMIVKGNKFEMKQLQDKYEDDKDFYLTDSLSSFQTMIPSLERQKNG